MEMKRTILVSLSCCFLSLIIVALLPSNAVSVEPPKTISFASSGEGTSQFAVHAGMTKLITKYTGIKAVPEASGAGGKTVRLLHNKEVELAGSTDHAAYEAARGLGPFQKVGKQDFRLLSAGQVSPRAMTTRADSGIRSMADLKGKRVQGTHPGNISFTKGMDIFLEAEGMSNADIKRLDFFGSTSIEPALKERRTDASLTAVSLRAVPGWLQRLNLEVPVYLFAPTKEKLIALLPKYPYVTMTSLAPRVYGKMINNKDLPTIGFGSSLYCRTDLPVDLVYDIMKAIFDHKDELEKFQKGAVEWTENPLGSAVIPYHAGAIKYYKEKGLWTPELENAQQKHLVELGSSK
jgi:TRAP transporter TAXI family solute receptor